MTGPPVLTLFALLAIGIGCDQQQMAAGDAASLADLRPLHFDQALAGVDGGTYLSAVRGTVVDDKGAPLASFQMSVCADQCFFGKSRTDGTFTVAIDDALHLDQYALEMHGSPDRTSYYTPLPQQQGDEVVFSQPLPCLPLPQDGPLIAGDRSAQELKAAGITLRLQAGTQVMVSPEDTLAGDRGRSFRPILVDVNQAAALPFIDRKNPPLALYAFSPFEVGFSMDALLSIDNRVAHIGLPAGTEVVFFAMRGLVGGRPPAGPFQQVATGRISADGTRTDMDAGIRSLSWLAIYKKGS